MALPFVADFTGAAGVLPNPPFGNWSTNPLHRNGSGLAVGGGLTVDAIAIDVSNTYTTGQKSTITVGTFGGHGTAKYYVYAGVNGAGSAEATGYWFWSDGGSDSVLNKVVAGVITALATSNALTFAAGDTFEVANDGSGNLTVKQNGTILSAFNFSDTTNTGGAPFAGVFQNDSSNVPNLTAWVGDDITTADILLGQICL
jgi:hypothetical protein